MKRFKGRYKEFSLILCICFTLYAFNVNIAHSATLSEEDKANRLEICSLFYEFEKSDTASFYKLCRPTAKNVYLEFICPIIEFKKTSNEADLLNALPAQKEKTYYLWDIDRIILAGDKNNHVNDSCKKDGILQSSTPADVLINILYSMMIEGSSEAARYYLFLFQNSNAESGEQMEEYLYQFISSHPKAFIKLWPVFKTYQDSLALSTTSIRKDLMIIKSRYIELCPNRADVACMEILNFLDNMGSGS